MRRMTLTLAAALAATAFTAAPASAQKYCDPGPCLDDVIAEKVADTLANLRELSTDDVIWVVKCIGDSLGGNSCHQ